MLDYSKYSQNIFSPCLDNGARICFSKGEGAYLYDNNKTYIDFWNCFGSVLLGHNDGDVIDAIRRAIDYRNLLNAPTDYLNQFSDLILEDYPNKDQIAIFNSGTSAVKAAVTIAIKYTTKNIILSSGYHGWDAIWSKSDLPLSPNQYNVIDFYYIQEELERLLEKYKGQIAAVVISPDKSYFSNEFYKHINDVCKQNNIFIIVDDVKVGYRYNVGASLPNSIIDADIYVVSKCIANGSKISCVIGGRSVLNHGQHFYYTSFFDMYPIITAIATLKKQKSQNIHTKINDIGNQFISEALKVINSLELPIEIKGNGNLFQFILYNDALSRNFFVESINQGLLFYVGDNQCISFAFNQTICGHALDRLEKVLKKLRKKFPNLVAKKVDATRLFLTAYNQIDGCIESMSYQQKINFINNIYKNRTFLPK